MKIAILDLDNLKNPFWGSGGAKVTYEVGKRLAKKHEVTVYCSKYKGYKDYSLEGISYKHIGIVSNNHFVTNILYILSLPFVVPFIKADIILENFTAPISTNFTPLYTKTPVVGISSFFAADILGKKYHAPFGFIEKIGAKFYKYFIALNKIDQQKMKKLNSKINSKVIYNGIDEHIFSLKTKEKNYILFVGRIDINQKGLDILIEALAKVADDIPDDLILLGSGPESEETALRNLIKKHNLTKRVHMKGKITGTPKDTYVAESKFIVFSSRYEGMSLSALEAAACGKPIVCFDIPGFEWLQHNKEVLKAKQFDVNEYAEALRKLSKSKELRTKLSSNIATLAKQFTWDETAKQYESYISSIVKS